MAELSTEELIKQASGLSTDELIAAHKAQSQPAQPKREIGLLEQMKLAGEGIGGPQGALLGAVADPLHSNAVQVGAPITASLAGSPLLGVLVASALNSGKQIQDELSGKQQEFKRGEAVQTPLMMAASPLKAAGVLGTLGNAAINAGGTYGLEKLRNKLDEPAGTPDNAATQGAVAGGLTALMPLVGRVAGAALGRVSPKEEARIAQLILNNKNKDEILAKMQSRGATVVPSSVNPSIKNKVLESIAGIQNVEAGVARQNQPLFNAIGREEASIPANVSINQASLEAARSQIAAPYRAAREGNIGDLLDEWRGTATKLKEAEGKIAGGNFTPERGAAVDRAQAAHDLASAALDDAANGTGLGAEIAAAKMAFGKNYDVDRAVLGGTDEVRPSVLSQLLEQKGERGLTGGLQDIAKFHNNFERSTKNPAKMATAPGAASAGTAMIAGGGNPAATVAYIGGVPLIRGSIRDVLVSPKYQAENARRIYSPKTTGLTQDELGQLVRSFLIQQAINSQNRPN